MFLELLVSYILSDIEKPKSLVFNNYPKQEIVNPHPFAKVDDPYREDLHGELFCSCIRTARSFGANIPYGTDARDLKPNSKIEDGAIALFSYYGEHHVAYILKIEEDGFWIKEGNYKKCQYSKRFIKWDDYFLLGFYSSDII